MTDIPKKPYLVRAFYQWISDNGWTPYLLVDATVPKTQVPEDYIQNNQILLNIKPTAIRDLDITNKHLSFRATFSGNEEYIHVPMIAIRALYAKENNDGIIFEPELEEDYGDDDSDSGSPEDSHLKIIK